MSEESGLYDVVTIEGNKFRVWQSTGTIECMSDGRWTSIPQAAQAVISAMSSALVRAYLVDGEWTEGVCGDGTAILLDGEPVPIAEVLAALNSAGAAVRAEREGCAKVMDQMEDHYESNPVIDEDTPSQACAEGARRIRERGSRK